MIDSLVNRLRANLFESTATLALAHAILRHRNQDSHRAVLLECDCELGQTAVLMQQEFRIKELQNDKSNA